MELIEFIKGLANEMGTAKVVLLIARDFAVLLIIVAIAMVALGQG